MAFKKIFKKDAAVAGVALTRLAGFAAALGGALWVVKGVAGFVAGDQPVYILEVVPLLLLGYVALLLFALGLVGLHTRLEGHGGKSGWVGGALAWASIALAPVVVGSFVFFFLIVAPDEIIVAPDEIIVAYDEITFLLTPMIGLTWLLITSSLVLLGIAVRRVGALPGRWRWLPLSMGVAGLPLIMISPYLALTLDGRLLDSLFIVPGLAWVMLGWRISRSS